MLTKLLQSLGFSSNDFKLRPVTRDLWLLILAAEGIDEASSATVLAIIDKIDRTERKKTVDKLAMCYGRFGSRF